MGKLEQFPGFSNTTPDSTQPAPDSDSEKDLIYERKPDGSELRYRTEEEKLEMEKQIRKYISQAIDNVLNDKKLMAKIEKEVNAKIGENYKKGYSTKYPDEWERGKEEAIGKLNLLIPVGGEGEEKKKNEEETWSRNMWSFDRDIFLKESVLEAVKDRLFFDHAGEYPNGSTLEKKDEIMKEYGEERIMEMLEDEVHGIYENVFMRYVMYK
jgi:hypothetical protein